MEYPLGISRRRAAHVLAATFLWLGSTAGAAPRLEVYQPAVALGSVHDAGASDALPRYNHAPDVVRFQGRFIAAWMGNPGAGEGKPGQSLYFSTSDDFKSWSAPARLFGTEGPVSDVGAIPWQPAFVNYRDEVLFCAWSLFGERRMIVSRTTDGVRWTHQDILAAPAELAGKVVGFPSGHGIVTGGGQILIPCCLPPTDQKGLWIRNADQAVLRSVDAGATWEWSEPIHGARWSDFGEDPARYGGDDAIYHWELSLFESADGSIGYVARNTSRMPDPAFASYRALLSGKSVDGGRTWSPAGPADVDSVSARPFAAKRTPADGLLVSANDWVRSVPEPAWNTRFGLSLLVSPVDDPDFLLPGPLVQPESGAACYPDGFVHGDRLYLVYTQGRGAYGYANIRTAVVSPLPDFRGPFLLPRGARAGLRIEGRVASFCLPEATLGLVLTPALANQRELTLAFESRLDAGVANFPVLSIGGKARRGVAVRVVADPATGGHRYQAGIVNSDTWVDLASCGLGRWARFVVRQGPDAVVIAVDDAPPVRIEGPVLRKIAFGGLHAAPAWPRPAPGIRPAVASLRLDSVSVR